MCASDEEEVMYHDWFQLTMKRDLSPQDRDNLEKRSNLSVGVSNSTDNQLYYEDETIANQSCLLWTEASVPELSQ